MPRIEWMCTHCGKRTTQTVAIGRPEPGRCPRKKNGGPHTWVKNKELI